MSIKLGIVLISFSILLYLKFALIDWRQRFGSRLDIGDVYYDLGKMYHAILINGQCMLKDMFSYTIEGNTASVDFYVKSNLVYFMDIFKGCIACFTIVIIAYIYIN